MVNAAKVTLTALLRGSPHSDDFTDDHATFCMRKLRICVEDMTDAYLAHLIIIRLQTAPARFQPEKSLTDTYGLVNFVTGFRMTDMQVFA